MEARIQKRGHCQGCGRLQAATAGVLAHHGYKVEYGYFNGTCFGAKKLPLEVSRELLDSNVAKALASADEFEARALRFKNGEADPAHYRKGHSKTGRLVPYAELDEMDRRRARAAAIAHCEAQAHGLRGWVKDMLALADRVHGQPLLEVKVNDQSKVIGVGDTVKVWGREVVVVAIENRRAQGVGPGINGQYVDHVIWQDGDKRHAYPKRYARKVVA